ncbi:MAG: discoidin domain-containing protein [Candidatus Omnitrophica bacterium]|nr:discoidin domain-containing protein [Candidatus Omnitrophota bacterium]
MFDVRCGFRRGIEHRTSNIELGRRGAALFVTFLLMLVMAGLALAVGVASHNSLMGGKSQLHDKQAFYLAEAGWQRARQALVAGTWTAAASPGNTYTESFGAGEYSVTIVDNGDSTYTITSSGYIPSQASAIAQRRVVEASAAAGTSSGTNLSLAATASASSSNGTNLPALAKDALGSTHWEAGTNGNGQWLAMDYLAATTLNQIIVEEHNFIDGVTIEYSDDASSWTTVSGLSVVESPAKTWTADFTASSHRYFRAVFTASASNKKVAVTEMESYSTSFSLGTGTFRTQW